MKKKAIKIAASTAVAASAFVAAAPAQQADAATNVNQLIADAQNAGTVLKWAISVEGTANYKDEPWTEYNNAKNAVKKAEDAIAKLGTSEKLAAQAKLVDPKVSITRAGAYIDAITSGKKILDKNAAFEAAVKTGDLDKVETAYHVVTEEFRKQTILNYRVYGQSTRDEILKEYKLPIEKTVRGYANEVTVHMLTKAAAADVKANKLEDAAKKLTEAQSILNDNELKWESTLQKSADDVAESMPLQVLSVTSDGKTKVTVKFSKEVAPVLPAGQFTFDNGLTVTDATVLSDKKTVVLTTSNQAAGKTYKLSYQGKESGSFTTAAAPGDNLNFVDAKDTARLELGQTRKYTVTLKNLDGTPYTGAVKIDLFNSATARSNATVATDGNATNAKVTTVGGETVGASTFDAVAGPNGVVTFVVQGSTAYNEVYPRIVKAPGNDKEELIINAGATYYFPVAGNGADDATATPYAEYQIGTVDSDFVDKTNKVIYANNQKFFYDANDEFQKTGSSVTLEQFEAALSINDKIVINYFDEKGSTSLFNITNDVSVAPLKVTSPSVDVTYNGTNYSFQGTGKANSTIYVLEDNGTVGTFDNGTDRIVATAVVNGSGNWSANASNLANGAQKFLVVQVDGVNVGLADLDGKTTSDINVSQTPTVIVGPFAAASVSKGADNGDNVLGENDVINFTFINANPLHAFKVASNATITLGDNVGNKATFKVTKNAAGSLLLGDLVSKSGDYDGSKVYSIKAITGVTNANNLPFSIADSVEVVVD